MLGIFFYHGWEYKLCVIRRHSLASLQLNALNILITSMVILNRCF